MSSTWCSVRNDAFPTGDKTKLMAWTVGRTIQSIQPIPQFNIFSQIIIRFSIHFIFFHFACARRRHFERMHIAQHTHTNAYSCKFAIDTKRWGNKMLEDAFLYPFSVHSCIRRAFDMPLFFFHNKLFPNN